MNISTSMAYRELRAKSPTSRKEREKWGTQHKPQFSKRGRNKISWTIVEFRLALRLYREGQGNRPAPNAVTKRRRLQENGEIMAQYLAAIHQPNNCDPSVEGELMQRETPSTQMRNQ